MFPRLFAMTVATFALGAWGVTPAALAQERLSWDAGCEPIHERLATAFEDAPDMALGNRAKVERLLRDARVAASDEDCIVKLRRAHALIAQAYDDAGESLAVMRGDGG
jgi:predicted N-formylglutamate amidohydrolase